MVSTPATVYLVGAGPGAPGLLTLRGREVLERAQAVVHDALVHPALLRLAPEGAERIYVGKRSGRHHVAQPDLNRLLVDRARRGQTVVRLKGGDPFVFGRGGEEAQELERAGIPFEVVPGVSSVSAAAACAGIPLTHRDHCSSYTVVTGHEDPAKPGSMIDWEALARMPGTKVILMGMERLEAIAGRLRRGGMDPGTPAAAIEWGTTARQRVAAGTLADIPQRVAQAGLGAPSLVVLGTVAALRESLCWFERRPLFGRRVVVTRARRQAGRLSGRLEDLGADVLEIPVIRTGPPDDPAILEEAIGSLGEYDWLVFTSPNGADAFFEAFSRQHDDIRALGLMRIAAVGPATAGRVRARGLRVDAMPERHVAPEIARAVEKLGSVENLRFLMPRAQQADPELPDRLHDLGAIVDDVPAYRTGPEEEEGEGERFLQEGAHWVAFTSASTVSGFDRRFTLDGIRRRFPGIRWASIGPETSRRLRDLGQEPDREARRHDIPGLVEALVEESGRIPS